MAQDPGVSRGELRRRVKLLLDADDSESQLDMLKIFHARVSCYGTDTPDSVAEKVWSFTVGNLTYNLLKFILNAASDTLPHNCNLKLYGDSV